MLLSTISGGALLFLGFHLAGLPFLVALAFTLSALALVCFPAVIILDQTLVSNAKLARFEILHGELTRSSNTTLSKIVWQTAKGRDTASSLGRLAPKIRTMQKQVSAIEKRQMNQERQATSALETVRMLKIQRDNPFAPNNVSASKAVAQSGHKPGRAAASRPDDPLSALKLATLLSSTYRDQAPRLSLICTKQTVQQVSSLGAFTEIHPTYGTPALPEGTAYLVIEDRALMHGPWATALQTHGTHLYRQLDHLVQQSRDSSVVVVYIDTGVPPTHFSGLLKAAAHVTIKEGQITSRKYQGPMPSTLYGIAHATHADRI